jgi:protein gp37
MKIRDMGLDTSIGWCEHTWNLWLGCQKVSPACDHCYAARDDVRYGGGKHWGAKAPRLERMHWRKQLESFKRAAIKDGKKHRIFLGSTMDIFEKPMALELNAHRTTDDVRKEAFLLMEDASMITFLLLTKRPQNIIKYIPEHWKTNCPANVWFGCTVVNQEEADRDIPHLLQAPGIDNKFLSIEPILGRVDLMPHLLFTDFDLANNPSRIGWVIAGGESGHGARVTNPDWFRLLQAQCEIANVPFFFKQWGVWYPNGESWTDIHSATHESMIKAKSSFDTGNMLDGKIHENYPQSMTEKL